MNSIINVGLWVAVAALLTFSVIATKKRFPKLSKNMFAALMLGILFFSAASTSPTLVKALDEITTISTITDKVTDTITTEFTDTPYYEGQKIPSEITVTIDGKEVTFTNLQMVGERADPNGPYTLVDGSGNTLYFYEGSLLPGDDTAEGQGWVLLIPDGKGGTITAPAHNIQFDTKTQEMSSEPGGEEIYYIYTDEGGATHILTFTGDTSLREVLAKTCSNTVYFQSGSDKTVDENDVPDSWIIRIYYGSGENEFIEVPAHEVQLDEESSRTLDDEGIGEKYYYYKDGELYEFTWPGGGGEAPVSGEVYEEVVSGTETSYVPIYLFEGSNPITDASGDIPSNWVLRIPDPGNPGQYITVGDLSEVRLGSNLGAVEATGMKIYYYDSEGNLRDFAGQTYSYARTVYEGDNTVLLYEGSENPREETAEEKNWVLRIYYGPGKGDYIEVPAHNVKVGNNLGAIEADGMKLYYVEDGQLYEFIGDDLHELYDSTGVKPLFIHAGELPGTGDDIPKGWILRIYYGSGENEYIEVPAHKEFVLKTIPQGEDGPYENLKDTDGDGEPDTVVLPDGTEVPASRVEPTFAGVERLFFSLNNPGNALVIGKDQNNPDLTNLDGNDIIEYSNGKFTKFFDLNGLVSPTNQMAYEIDAASIICGQQIYFSTNQPGSVGPDNKIYPSGWPKGPGPQYPEFEKYDILRYDMNTGKLEIWWSPVRDAGVTKPDNIDAVSVRNIDNDDTLEVLFSIVGQSQNDAYGSGTGKMTAADIFVWDPDLSEFKKILEDGSNPETGDDSHFDYTGDHPPGDIDAMAVIIIGDKANQYLLSFAGGWYNAGKNDDPRNRYEVEDIIFYDASAKTASMFFDGSEYFHVPGGGTGGADIDAVSYCGTILVYKGWVYLYDAQGHAHLFDAKGKPYIFDAKGKATVQVGEEIVVFEAIGKAYVFDPQGYAYIYDLRGEATMVTESYRYLVKSTTERPFTQTMGPQAMFITCYNYTNRTSTVTLQHTTITTTFEVCVETTTTTSPTTSWFTSIVYSGLAPSDGRSIILLLAGFLAIVAAHTLTARGERRRSRVEDHATLKA